MALPAAAALGLRSGDDVDLAALLGAAAPLDRPLAFDSVLPFVAELVLVGGLLLAADDSRLLAMSFVSLLALLAAGADSGRLAAVSADAFEAVAGGSHRVVDVAAAAAARGFGARLTRVLMVTAGFASADGLRGGAVSGLRAAGALATSPLAVTLAAVLEAALNFGLAGEESFAGGLAGLVAPRVGLGAALVRGAAAVGFGAAVRGGTVARGDVSLFVVEETAGFFGSVFGAAGFALDSGRDGLGAGFDGFVLSSGFLMMEAAFLVSVAAVVAAATVATAAAVTALAVTAAATALGCDSAAALSRAQTGRWSGTGCSSAGTCSGSLLASDSRSSDSSLSLSMVEVTSGSRSV